MIRGQSAAVPRILQNTSEYHSNCTLITTGRCSRLTFFEAGAIFASGLSKKNYDIFNSLYQKIAIEELQYLPISVFISQITSFGDFKL